MNILTVDPKNRLTAFQALGNKWLRGKATKFDNLSLTIDTMRENIIRKKTQAFLINQSKQWRNKKPSLCQKYLPKDVYMWLQKTTKYGTSLVDCVKSGVENPDSIIGLYAPDSDCYDVFPEIFWPVISDYHKIDVFSLKAHHEYGAPNDLPDFEPPYADDIFSVRIKVGRTLKNYPMGPKLSRETRQLIKNEMIQSFADLNGEQYGDFFELTDLSYEERDSLIQSHYLFNNADDKYLRSAGGYADW